MRIGEMTADDPSWPRQLGPVAGEAEVHPAGRWSSS
jgi:hypothetical protein